MCLKKTFVFSEYVFYHGLHIIAKRAKAIYALVDAFEEKARINFFAVFCIVLLALGLAVVFL